MGSLTRRLRQRCAPPAPKVSRPSPRPAPPPPLTQQELERRAASERERQRDYEEAVARRRAEQQAAEARSAAAPAPVREVSPGEQARRARGVLPVLLAMAALASVETSAGRK